MMGSKLMPGTVILIFLFPICVCLQRLGIQSIHCIGFTFPVTMTRAAGDGIIFRFEQSKIIVLNSLCLPPSLNFSKELLC